MFKYSMTLLAGLCLVASVGADNGLVSLFEQQSHDFGNVPIGPLLRTSFTLKNTTGQNIRIVSARVSCGCVSPFVTPGVVAPGASTTVHATMDTRRFVGAKQVTIYVLFDQPNFEEVSLSVTAFGRKDITLTSDTLAFGRVRKGSSPDVATTVTFLGNSRITEAACESSYVKLVIGKPVQTPSGLSYTLTAKLSSDIPVGNWFTDVWVKLDQAGSSRIRIPLTVDVEPNLMVTPGAVDFDTAEVGKPMKKPIIVKGNQPFKIVDVKGGDGVFTAAATTSEARAVHIVNVTFTPGKEGEVMKNLKIITDLKDEGQVDLKVKGTGTGKK